VVIDEAHRLRNVYKPANVIANTLKRAPDSRHTLLFTTEGAGAGVREEGEVRVPACAAAFCDGPGHDSVAARARKVC
jgi:hypothetical protein